MSGITTLCILGASGDLASRLLLPALGQLLAAEPTREVRLLGAGQDDWSDAQWRDWTARNAVLPTWLSRRVPPAAVAGNLAWQGNAFGASNSLRQDNVFARLSWQHERWQTALDVLYTPADQGTISTASLLWSGDRVKLEAGLRAHGGPDRPAIVDRAPECPI